MLKGTEQVRCAYDVFAASNTLKVLEYIGRLLSSNSCKSCKSVPGEAKCLRLEWCFLFRERSRKRVIREFNGQDNHFLGIHPGLPGSSLADRSEEHGHES